jgi:hypothetical protein
LISIAEIRVMVKVIILPKTINGDLIQYRGFFGTAHERYMIGGRMHYRISYYNHVTGKSVVNAEVLAPQVMFIKRDGNDG